VWKLAGKLLISTCVLSASTVFAQPTELKYDEVRADNAAQISCGFCAMHKFGTIFYLSDFQSLSFPLDLTKLKLALTQSVPTTQDIEACTAASSGTASISYEVYVGQTTQANFNSRLIRSFPLGAWPNETSVTSGSAQVTLSVPTGSPNGSNPNYSLALHEIPITNARNFGTSSDRYIRVVFDVPSASTMPSPFCERYNLTSPSAVPFRDDAIARNTHKSFGHVGNLGFDWFFNEDFLVPFIVKQQTDGDWVIRIEVQPATQAPSTDAGTSVPSDSGQEPLDPLEIFSITPRRGDLASTTPVMISGSGFVEQTVVRVGSHSLLDLEVLDASTIRGTVTAGLDPSGAYDVIVENPNGQIATLNEAFSVTCTPLGLRVTVPSLLEFPVNQAVDYKLTATDGYPPYQWRLDRGQLPLGLSLVDDAIVGIPTSMGTETFVLEVTDLCEFVTGVVSVKILAEGVGPEPDPGGVPGSTAPNTARTSTTNGSNQAPILVARRASGSCGCTHTVRANIGKPFEAFVLLGFFVMLTLRSRGRHRRQS